MISIVETCIDLAYPERARNAVSSTSAASSSSAGLATSSTSKTSALNTSSRAASSTSRPTSSDRKGKQPERQLEKEEHTSIESDETSSIRRKIVPFKAFSAYANYPFSLDSDSDNEGDDNAGRDDITMMDVFTPPALEQDAKARQHQRKGMNAHQREIRLLELEKSFMRNFVSEYKDLPSLVHTYGFALQCLVNVGVRGSESIRTRVVEAGVLGVVARILGGFLDYRAGERDKRSRIIANAQAEKEKEKDLSIQINGGGTVNKRERERHHTNANSGDSDVTAVLTMSTRRERREREAAVMAAQAQTLALAQAQVNPNHHQSQSQAYYGHQGNTPLVAGMPAPPNAASVAAGASSIATPRQTRSAAVQALLNSSTEVPTRPPRQFTSAIIQPSSHSSHHATLRVSPRRAGSSSSTSSSTSMNMPSSSSAAVVTTAAVSSLVAGALLINRTNTPDTIASLDEVQEFSDVNPDENESTTSSNHEEHGSTINHNNNEIMMDGINVDSMTMMDVLGANESENELQSASAMALSSTMTSNPASRSVSRNRINANVLALHRPVPPPSSRLGDTTTTTTTLNQETQDGQSPTTSAAPQLEVTLTATTPLSMQAPNMIGDVTIKLARAPEDGDDTEEDGASVSNEGDVVMERDNDREDQESTDDTGTSASPVSRPASSQYMHHHHQQHQLASPSSRRGTVGIPRAQQMTRQDSTSSLTNSNNTNGMTMDSETTPISRPIPLRRQSSSSAAAAVSATPRNAFSTTTVQAQNAPANLLHQAHPSHPPTSYNFLSHATAISSQLETHLRSQTQTREIPVTNSAAAPRQQTNTSTQHVHLRLHPHLQQAAAAQPSVIRDGQAHLLLNYGPLMDHYVKEEDVLHCLHLLAYLSKYPHVRAVFHDPENEICKPPSSSTNAGTGEEAANNADASMLSTGTVTGNSNSNRGNCCSCARKKLKFGEEGIAVPDNGASTSSSASAASLSGAEDSTTTNSTTSACNGHCHAHAGNGEGTEGSKTHSRSTSSGSQKHGHSCCAANEEEADDEEAESLARARAMATMPAKDRKPALEPSRPPRSTANNVFSLVEQYTFRPSSLADRSMRLGTDIQYWAGVIMRNACRKDELRGGIRQCANMGCGVWERFPREFAKCRRCRKAKYCSKGCQRRAWQAGHR